MSVKSMNRKNDGKKTNGKNKILSCDFGRVSARLAA